MTTNYRSYRFWAFGLVSVSEKETLWNEKRDGFRSTPSGWRARDLESNGSFIRGHQAFGLSTTSVPRTYSCGELSHLNTSPRHHSPSFETVVDESSPLDTCVLVKRNAIDTKEGGWQGRLVVSFSKIVGVLVLTD